MRRLLILGILVFLPVVAEGQSLPQFSLDVQLSIIPLYEGDATVGRLVGTGPSVRASFLPTFGRGRAAIEAFAMHTFGSDGVQKPALTSFGVTIGTRLGRASGPLQIALNAGLGRLRFDLAEVPPCLPPLCFDEGGAAYQTGTTTAVVGGIGFIAPTWTRLGLRVDVRAHAPLASEDLGDSDDVRLEFAAGITFRW